MRPRNPTGDLTYYWWLSDRDDLVIPKFDAIDFSGVTGKSEHIPEM